MIGKIGQFTIVATTVTAMMSCASVSPKQNFQRILDRYVGIDVSSQPSYSFADPRGFSAEKTLPNGHKERIYTRKVPQGDCVYALELKGDIVVGWKVVEDNGGCVVVP